MSHFAAQQAAMRMNCQPVAICPSFDMTAQHLHMLSIANVAHEEEQAEKRRGELCAAYGFSQAAQTKPFAFADGLAIIPISGTLINRFGSSWGFITGYQFLRRQLHLALGDNDVKGIVFDVNSNGGEAAGCFELANEIRAARKIKPSMAVVDSNCHSAAYALASAAGKIICTPSGSVGSIGVVAMHVNMSKMLDQVGYKVEFITFGKHKVDGNPYQDLSDDARAMIQASVDKTGEMFVQTVALNQKLDAKKVRDTEARVYRADEAKSLGLISTIATPSEAMQVFFDELSGSESQPGNEEASMSTTTTEPGAQQTAAPAAPAVAAAPVAAPAAATPAAPQQDAAAVRAAEKARIAGIMNCEEAKTRPALANHLAMETEMSLESAQKLLAAAAPEQKQASSNAFKEAMNTGKQPNVPAGGNGDGNAAGSGSQELMASYSAATGYKFNKDGEKK